MIENEIIDQKKDNCKSCLSLLFFLNWGTSMLLQIKIHESFVDSQVSHRIAA